MSTTYTTAAGNLWVWTLGATADRWVRQLDRVRPRYPISETDTAALEDCDATNPIGPWFLLGAALGLKGHLVLERTGDGMHGIFRLLEDGVPVHLFAGHPLDVELPSTVVPALLLGETDAVELILAVVEVKSGATKSTKDAELAHIEQAVYLGKENGLTRADMVEVVERVFGVRRVNGYEVVPGWTMPECPSEIEGARLMIEVCGSDGLVMYWWGDEWEGSPHWTQRGFAEVPDPLVDPDANDPECLEAYRLLGFLT